MLKDKILKLLKNADGYLSGQTIAGELGLTRNAIHKHINSLRNFGYSIDSKRSSGYKLINDFNILDSSTMKSHFTNNIIGTNIIHYKTIDSTNNEAYRLAQKCCPDGTLVIGDKQSSGKGRMGRVWESSSRDNLYFSIVLRPQFPPSAVLKITLASAIAVCEAIVELYGLQPRVKWPNDVYIDGKKLCGILTEMRSESDAIDFIVIGIGVNVNSDIEDYPLELRNKITTLKHEASCALSKQALLEKIILNLEKWYIIVKEDDFGSMKISWDRFCYLSGRSVRIETHSEEIAGIVRGIDPDGFLLLECDGKLRRVVSGTVYEVI